MGKNLKTKFILVCAVLASVLAGGMLPAEAEWHYKVDDGTEQIWDGEDFLYGTGNKLEVWSSDGSDTANYFYICGGYDGGKITIADRTVIFNSGSIKHVYGGRSKGGNARENTVNINGGTVTDVYGGSGTSNATGNTVNITGGIVTGHVYGGYGDGDGDVIGNTVNLTDGTVTGYVYGGSGSREVSGNKVIISGGNLSSATICGYNESADSHSNNTLQINNPVTLHEIKNFENLYFVLPNITKDTTMLSLTDPILFYPVDLVPVSVNLGDNANTTLNTYSVTLADKVSENFDVTYYDKDNNATGYVEKFRSGFASTAALIIGRGAEMHITQNLTTAPGELLGKQNTIYVDDGVTVTFIGDDKLQKKVQGACNIIIDGDVKSDFANLANTGALTVNAGKTLTFTSESTLAKNITGAGTLELEGTMNVLGNQSIEGTLDGGDARVNMSNGVPGSPINSLIVGILKGHTFLELDVDLSCLTSDMIFANAVDSSANINIDMINITADTPAGMPIASNINFLMENGGTPTHGIYTVNSRNVSSIMTNTHTYKFEIGGNGILKCSEIGESTATFKDFIEGTGTGAGTFSLTADYNYTDTGNANMAAVTQTHDVLNINLNGHNLNKSSSVMTVATGAKTLNVNGGGTEGSTDLNFEVDNGGTLNISGRTDLKGNVTNAGDVTFTGETKAEGTLSGDGTYTNSGSMTVADASKLQMTSAINNSGNLEIGGGTLAQKVQGTGNIIIDGDVTTNANNIATTGTNTVVSGKTLTFTEGTLAQKVQGEGNLDFTGNVTANADNIATTGTNDVKNGAKLIFAGGTLRQNITGLGTAEFNGTVGVADGVNLGTVGNDVNGTLDVAGNITTETINFKNGSTLKVDGSQIMGTAAINANVSATVEEGAKLYVSNAIKDAPYKILAGNMIKVNSWQTDADMADGFKAAYGLRLDTSNIINDGTQFTIRFVRDVTALDNVDIGNLLDNAAPGTALYKYVDAVSEAQPDRATQATIINTMANANALANVQQGTQMVTAMATDAVQSNIGAGARPMLEQTAEGVGHKDGMRNVSADAKDSAAIEVVETGKADEVMPSAVVTVEQKYDKEVWANFIHSKKTIDGLKTGSLEQDSTIQFNGVTVGADLWSNAKGFGGFAFTTAEGKIHSYQDAASVKNDTDYHGVSLYQRYDYKGLALLMDLTYTHAKNDVTMSAADVPDVTAKPKADAYSAGLMIEKPIKLGHSTQLTPYTGARYTHIHTDDYENSLGINNDIKDQDIVSVPVGLQLKSEMETERGWKFGHILEGGYVWNFGDRQSEQRLGYQGVYDSIDFDVTGRGEYFLKTALTASHKDTDFELGYRFTRGDNEKDNKWNFNVSYNFGNSKGLPYKSVLLGKIDLLESTNKELRAENVDLKAENAELKVENAAIKEQIDAQKAQHDAQIAQLLAMIEELKNR